MPKAVSVRWRLNKIVIEHRFGMTRVLRHTFEPHRSPWPPLDQSLGAWRSSVLDFDRGSLRIPSKCQLPARRKAAMRFCLTPGSSNKYGDTNLSTNLPGNFVEPRTVCDFLQKHKDPHRHPQFSLATETTIQAKPVPAGGSSCPVHSRLGQ